MYKTFCSLCYSFIYKVKESVHFASSRSGCLNVYFYLVLPFYFLKCYFSVCENLPKCSCHFWKYKSISLQILHQSSVSLNVTSLYFLNWNIYFGQKEPIEVQNFENFECLGQNSSNFSRQLWNGKLIPLQICIILHCHET